MTTPINNNQIKRIHFLLRASGLQAQKQSLVVGFSKGRCESTKNLSFEEARQLINYLQAEANSSPVGGGREVAANRMRRKILSYCHNMKWENADGSVNMEALDKWCLHYSYLRKKLQEYTYKELPKLVSQVQKVYASKVKDVSNKSAQL